MEKTKNRMDTNGVREKAYALIDLNKMIMIIMIIMNEYLTLKRNCIPV